MSSDRSAAVFSLPLPWVIAHPERHGDIERAMEQPAGAIARSLIHPAWESGDTTYEQESPEPGGDGPSWLIIRQGSSQGGGYDVANALSGQGIPYLHDWKAGSEYGAGAEASGEDGCAVEVMTNQDCPVVACGDHGTITATDRKGVRRYAAVRAQVMALAGQRPVTACQTAAVATAPRERAVFIEIDALLARGEPVPVETLRRLLQPIRAVVAEFVADVSATGGIARNPDGDMAPVLDPQWTDLAAIYSHACAVLGVDPIMASASDRDAAGDG